MAIFPFSTGGYRCTCFILRKAELCEEAHCMCAVMSKISETLRRETAQPIEHCLMTGVTRIGGQGTILGSLRLQKSDRAQEEGPDPAGCDWVGVGSELTALGQDPELNLSDSLTPFTALYIY
ncbi:hypothetical protein SKAU_G00119760 [Synaphobranchus kaupii]|uniref:Uncharacterized protein n=1 Tax=Synaphobranchus kaupii TaxID=118154 RepID=A0A9Q1FNC4_SYNKA|nr:hypothetical protein SKAU_G00119760 [Synaphobranchus kaupii]